MIEGNDGVRRCDWAGTDPLMVAYHDTEWGVPCHDDGELFERLMLEGFQAGLSWSTILRKRRHFAAAFEGWDPRRVAAYDPDDIARLLSDPGIVRNRLKVAAAVRNAQSFLRVQEAFGTFDVYLWSFVDGAPLQREPPATMADVPIHTPESDALSRELKRRGFTFVGTTICYAFMQSVGMVDDHIQGCFRARATSASHGAPRSSPTDPVSGETAIDPRIERCRQQRSPPRTHAPSNHIRRS